MINLIITAAKTILQSQEDPPIAKLLSLRVKLFFIIYKKVG